LYQRLASGTASYYERYAAENLDLIATRSHVEPLSEFEKNFIIYDEDGEEALSMEFFSLSMKDGLQKHSERLEFLYDIDVERPPPTPPQKIEVNQSVCEVLEVLEEKASEDLKSLVEEPHYVGFEKEQSHLNCTQVEFGVSHFCKVHSFNSLINVRQERSTEKAHDGRASMFMRNILTLSSKRTPEPIKWDEEFHLMPGTLMIYAPPNSGKTTFNRENGLKFYDTDVSHYAHGVVLTNCDYFAWLWGKSGQRVIFIIPSMTEFRRRVKFLPGYKDSWYQDVLQHSIGLTLHSDKYVSDILKYEDKKIKVCGEWSCPSK
jgi:hypothetical protein